MAYEYQFPILPLQRVSPCLSGLAFLPFNSSVSGGSLDRQSECSSEDVLLSVSI